MAKDFRASQIETSKIILSGGLHQNVGAAIYSGSVASNRAGGVPAGLFQNVGSDVLLFVSGNIGGLNSPGGSTSLFGGDLAASGTFNVGKDILPQGDMSSNIGSPSLRFANMYTGDLHLRNERGSYTLIEEEDYLSIRNNKTGKLYKFVLEELK